LRYLKMKKLLFLILLFTVKIGFAQKDTTGLHIPVRVGVVVYESVVNVPGKTKGMINTNARIWFINLFKDSKGVQLNDYMEDGVVIAKGTILLPIKDDAGKVTQYEDRIIAEVDYKENSYKIVIHDQLINSLPTDNMKLNATPERLIGLLTGKEKLPINDQQARRLLASMNLAVTGIIKDFKAMMSAKIDGF
jgi:hypothetical protein